MGEVPRLDAVGKVDDVVGDGCLPSSHERP